MSTEQNKALVRRAYLDGINGRNLAVIDEVFAPDYVVYYPGVEPIAGRDKAREAIRAFIDAFPDIVFHIDDQIAEGDKVATRWSASGTFSGEFRGFPKPGATIAPSGRAVHFSACDVYLIKDGKIQVEWNSLEAMELYRQLGLVSAPGDAPPPSSPSKTTARLVTSIEDRRRP